jgi:hypothetical protein
MPLGFAKAIAKRLVGKEVEMYTSDEYETLNYAESNRSRSSVISGKLLEVDEECLIVEVTVRGAKSTLYVNSWSVMGICEIGVVPIWEMYTGTRNNKK